MWDTRVQSLGWEDLLEKEMATHSCTLAWKIPWTEESGRLQSMGSQRSAYVIPPNSSHKGKKLKKKDKIPFLPKANPTLTHMTLIPTT